MQAIGDDGDGDDGGIRDGTFQTPHEAGEETDSRLRQGAGADHDGDVVAKGGEEVAEFVVSVDVGDGGGLGGGVVICNGGGQESVGGVDGQVGVLLDARGINDAVCIFTAGAGPEVVDDVLDGGVVDGGSGLGGIDAHGVGHG